MDFLNIMVSSHPHTEWAAAASATPPFHLFKLDSHLAFGTCFSQVHIPRTHLLAVPKRLSKKIDIWKKVHGFPLSLSPYCFLRLLLFFNNKKDCILVIQREDHGGHRAGAELGWH